MTAAGEDTITIPTLDGPVTMPWVQASRVAELVEWFSGQGKDSTWHPSECGCCMIVHEDSDKPAPGGFIVGEDGGYNWESRA